jgi:hypothetical protein
VAVAAPQQVRASFQLLGYSASGIGPEQRVWFARAVASLLAVPADSVAVTAVTDAPQSASHRRHALQTSGGVTVQCAIVAPAGASTVADALDAADAGTLLMLLRASGLSGALGVRVSKVSTGSGKPPPPPPPRPPPPGSHIVPADSSLPALLSNSRSAPAFAVLLPLFFTVGMLVGWLCLGRSLPPKLKVPTDFASASK